jgi:very-short-patch-repair endonuclease
MSARDWIRSRAKQMRAELTPHERAIWRLLHEGELVALNWRKQAPFGDFILDFVSHPAQLVIEVDGSQHAAPAVASRDAERSEWLRSQRYQVLRFWNDEALRARDDVWRSIQTAALATPAAPRVLRWRASNLAEAQKVNAQITSSSMEEVAAKRPEEVRAPSLKKAPHEARSFAPLASPPQSSLRDDSSSIEEERS